MYWSNEKEIEIDPFPNFSVHESFDNHENLKKKSIYV